MRKKLSYFSVFIFTLIFLAVFSPAKIFAAGTCEGDAPVLITGLQAGVSYHPYDEFVELYNCTDQSFDLGGYKLTLKDDAGEDITAVTFTENTLINPKSFLIAANQYYVEYLSLISSDELNVPISYDKVNGIGADGGHVILKDRNDITVNEVSYGLSDSTSAPKPPSDQSIKRCTNNGIFASGTDAENFLVTPLPTLSYIFAPGPPCVDNSTTNPGDGSEPGSGSESSNGDSNDNNQGESSDDTGGQGAGPLSNCDGVIINELLPNPAGTDTAHEFIELYNPTQDIIGLAGCKLQTSASSKTYELTDDQLQPGQYSAFYNDKTGLTLNNSSGGIVYLLDSTDNELNEVDYPAELDDDVSWSLIDGSWHKTFSITPNKTNELLESKPCPAGQVRNLETNRCVNIVEEAAGLVSCPEGKERNPATNRCHNIASLASILKACAANQIRNPVTNRCKKIDSSTSALAPCKSGQERNPQTHRCRKISASTSSDGLKDVKDVLSASTQSTANWMAAGLAVLGALSYAVFEWRNEITQQFGILKSKFS